MSTLCLERNIFNYVLFWAKFNKPSIICSSIISAALLWKMPKGRVYSTVYYDFNLWDWIQKTCTPFLGVLSTICTSSIGWGSSVSHNVVSIEKKKFVHKLRSQTCPLHVKQDLILLWNAVRRCGRCWHTVVLAGEACKVGTLRCSFSPPLQGTIVEGSCTFWLVLN